MQKAIFTFPIQAETPHKSLRDELFHTMLSGINSGRESAGYAKISAKRLAIALNSNPFLKSDSELEYIVRTCEKAGNWKLAWWTLFPKKV